MFHENAGRKVKIGIIVVNYIAIIGEFPVMILNIVELEGEMSLVVGKTLAASRVI